MRVEPREHPGRSLGMEVQRGHRRLCVNDLQHPSPEPAQGAKLGHGEEEVGIRSEREADLSRRRRCRHPGGGQGAQIGDPGGDGERQLLRLAGATGVIGTAIGEEGRDAGPGGRRRQGQGGGGFDAGRNFELCSGDCGAQRVGIEFGAQQRPVDPLLLGQFEEPCRGWRECGAGLETNDRDIQEHTGKELLDVRGLLGHQSQVDRGSAALEVLENRRIGRDNFDGVMELPDIPAAASRAGGRRAPDEWRGSRHAGIMRSVGRCVERSDTDFVGGRVDEAVGGSAFQHLVDQPSPRQFVERRELPGEHGHLG